MRKVFMCQHCGNAPATVFLHQEENGRITEAHLCGQCAESLEIGKRWEAQWQECLAEFWKPFAPLWGGAISFPCATQPVETQPADAADKTLQTKRERNALECALREAVQAEEYEKAAQLRDQLRALPNCP